MDISNILFGYISRQFENEPASVMLLHKDGLLVYEREGEKRAAFSVSGRCMEQICEILSDNRGELIRCADKINRNSEGRHSPENAAAITCGENYFIFDGLAIVDWDLTRWYLEEDRKKHPDYYDNSVKVELTETLVRGVFNEICSVIEEDKKTMHYARLVI